MVVLEGWPSVVLLFGVATMLKVLLLAPGVYHSTDFEVHRNWLAVTHSLPLKDWYWDDTSEWTLDYPPLFGYFQWVLSQVATVVEPDLVKIVPHYDPSAKAVWFQRSSVTLVDAALVFGVMAWCRATGSAGVARDGRGGTTSSGCRCTSFGVGALVLFNSGLIIVDHIHFQYNGFLLGLLLLSMGLIKHDRELLGGAAFACLLMLKHLFLALAPLFFVYLLRGYCCPDVPKSKNSSARKSTRDGGRDAMDPAPRWSRLASKLGLERLSFARLTALGSVVLGVFGLCLGPLCVSDGLSVATCARQLEQLSTRLFPFGRGLVHAYWAPNVWALYLFSDRMLLTALKFLRFPSGSDGYVGSTTGGLVRTVIMAVLPSVPASACLLLSLLACLPALHGAWKRPTPTTFVWGAVHCSLSSFLWGFHVHEKALLIPTVVSALLAFESRAGARMHLRLCFLASFAAFPLLPGPELRILKVLVVLAHLALVTSLLHHRFPDVSAAFLSPGSPTGAREMTIKIRSFKPGTTIRRERSSYGQEGNTPSTTREEEASCASDDGRVLVTVWDKAYLTGAVLVFALGEVLHPWLFGNEGILRPGLLPFLPLMSHSVYGALGVVACWVLCLKQVIRHTEDAARRGYCG